LPPIEVGNIDSTQIGLDDQHGNLGRHADLDIGFDHPRRDRLEFQHHASSRRAHLLHAAAQQCACLVLICRSHPLADAIGDLIAGFPPHGDVAPRIDLQTGLGGYPEGIANAPYPVGALTRYRRFLGSHNHRGRHQQTGDRQFHQ
jgi:hypothetical protein